MKRTSYLLSAMLGVAFPLLTTVGCGDGAICQQESLLLVSVAGASGSLVSDSNPNIEGNQITALVQSTIVGSIEFRLEVKDATGAVVATAVATADQKGNAAFQDVTVPSGDLTFEVFADAGACGTVRGSLAATVIGNIQCGVTVAASRENAAYAPRRVLLASDDTDAAISDLQTAVLVTTVPGWNVQLLSRDSGSNEELLLEQGALSGSLEATVTLRDGIRDVFARCFPADESSEGVSSSFVPLFVDTLAPTCEFSAPVTGSSLTPASDIDGDLVNDLQFNIVLHSSDADTVGQLATLNVVPPPGTIASTSTQVAIGNDGNALLLQTFTDDVGTAGSRDWTIDAVLRDRAGNECTASTQTRVAYNGCDITATSTPSRVDGSADAGIQVGINVVVGAECVGRTVTSTCGSTDLSFAATGNDNVFATVCTGPTCEASTNCTFSVTSQDGITTSSSTPVVFDNIAPSVAVQMVAPSVACGSTIAPSADVNSSLPGVQVLTRVFAGVLTETRTLRQTNPDASIELLDASDAGGEVAVTLEPGVSQFVGLAFDALGNQGTSATCSITLADIAVNFGAPVNDGVVGASEGAVAAGTLTLNICGTTSVSGASVALAVDGGAAQAAVTTGTAWCVNSVTLSEGSHNLVATATSGFNVGSASLPLNVDLTGPGPSSALNLTQRNRQTVRVRWNAPSPLGGTTGYLVKVSNTAITDANFASLPIAAALNAPGTAGSQQTIDIDDIRPGAEMFVAVAAQDGAGNISTIVSSSITLNFTAQGPITLAAPVGDAALGFAMVAGHFNSDSFEDLAVAAPFENGGNGRVYIYFGSAAGLSVSPGVTLQGTVPAAQFGNALAKVKWSGGTADDLVVSAPFDGGLEGKIYVYNGGGGFSGTLTEANAAITISSMGGWFAGSAVGFSLATADVDGNGAVDLVASAPGAAGFTGGIVVIHGGSITGATVRLSDLDSTQLGGAAVTIFENPTPGADFFGLHLHNTGRQNSVGAREGLLIGYSDDKNSTTTTNNHAYLLRGITTASSDQVSAHTFTLGTDVELTLAGTDNTTDFGAALTTLDDMNSDGVRELAISAFRENFGVVYIINGATIGDNSGVASVNDPAVQISRILPSGASDATQFGDVIANNALSPEADVDGDGRLDLIIGARAIATPAAKLFVWYGGSIGTGTVSADTAALILTAPATVPHTYPNNGGPPGVLLWVDITGDGLRDLATSSSYDNGRDGLVFVWKD